MEVPTACDRHRNRSVAGDGRGEPRGSSITGTGYVVESLEAALWAFDRLYSEAHVDAPEENCGRANALLDEHIEQVASRFRELNLLEQNLRRLRSHCYRTEAAKHCGILQSLSATPKAPLLSSLGHHNSRLFRTHK
jgi:hypothetical protein